MRINKTILILLVVTLTISVFSGASFAENRTSLALVGGLGFPVGWWSDRWDPIQTSEINLHYEFTPGTGFMILTGLNKTYFAEMSKEDVEAASRFSDTPEPFKQYTTVNKAYQGGSFSVLPMGFGFYTERMINTMRVYGSLAMVVVNWKVDRSQELDETVSLPDLDLIMHIDNWWETQDGSEVGAQGTLGLMYNFYKNVSLDVSAAFNFLNIGKRHGALVYYGAPAKVPAGDPDNALIEGAEGGVSSVNFRLGLRIAL